MLNILAKVLSGKGKVAAAALGKKAEQSGAAAKAPSEGKASSSPVNDAVKSLTDPMEYWKRSKARLNLITQHGEGTVKSAEKQAYKAAKVYEDPVKMSAAKVRKAIMDARSSRLKK